GFWLSTNGGSTSLILNYAPSATYNLSAAASAAAIRVGGTSTITASVTSSTATLTNPDTMSYTGLVLSGGLGALSSTSGTVAPGVSSSGNVAFTPVGSGSFTFSPSVSTATNVNILTSANAGTNSGVTVSVYNPASANSAVSTVSLGNVYASGTFGTQALSIWNTGTAAAAYQEGLAATISGTSGQASGSGSVTNLFTSSTSTAISVGLGGSVNTGSAGVKSGTVTLGFTSTGTTSVGATGLSPLALGSQSVAVTGTVWNAAAVNAITSPVTLGNVRVSGTFGTQALSIQNTAASGSFTEVLGATGSTSGQASLTGSVAGLAGGGTSTAISVGLGGANTSTAGVKSGSATISFTSTGGPGTAVISNQTVAISGTVWNPAAANSISGTIDLGTVLKGTSLSQALSVTNTA
ncbi:MAG: choice-of-anchor D domain-containing protein, partial [Planctomycetia bacterium]|nr:choice-of-anchor D domain-containing protein [Planctomycetia bacterium]